MKYLVAFVCLISSALFISTVSSKGQTVGPSIGGSNSYYGGSLSNLTPNNLKFWRRALAIARAQTCSSSPCTVGSTGVYGPRPLVVFLGDSQTAGLGAGTSTGCAIGGACNAYAQGPVASFAAATSAANANFNGIFGTSLVEGVLCPSPAPRTCYPQFDSRVTFGTGWQTGTSSLGGGMFQCNGCTGASPLTFVPKNLKFDTVNVLYPIYNAGGTTDITINVDGSPLGSCTALNENNTTQSLQLLTCANVPDIVHTNITVTANSSGGSDGAFVDAVWAYDSTVPGVDVFQATMFGTGAAYPTPAPGLVNYATAVDPWDSLNTLAKLAPTLTVISLDGADVVNNASLTTYQTNLSAIVNTALCGFSSCSGHAQTGDVLLVLGPLANAANFLSGLYASYDYIVYQIAQQNNLPVLDMRKRWISYANINPVFPFVDAVHPGTLGAKDYGLAFYEALLNP